MKVNFIFIIINNLMKKQPHEMANTVQIPNVGILINFQGIQNL